MSNKEALHILSLVSVAYPVIEVTEESITLWETMLKEVDYNVAARNLHRHMLMSKYPPTIAEIAASNGSVEAEQRKRETAERLDMLEGWNCAACLPAGGNTE